MTILFSGVGCIGSFDGCGISAFSQTDLCGCATIKIMISTSSRSIIGVTLISAEIFPWLPSDIDIVFSPNRALEELTLQNGRMFHRREGSRGEPFPPPLAHP